MERITYTFKPRNVHIRGAFDEIFDFMDEAILSSGVMWSNEDHRDSIVEFVKMFMDTGFIDKYNITQTNVVCDKRNNKIANLITGNVHFDVSYKHKNSLNTTTIEYKINLEKIELNLSDLNQ